MKRFSWLFGLVAACGATQQPPVNPTPAPPVPAPAPAPAPAPGPASDPVPYPPPAAYSGLGEKSLSPETIAKFAATPLDPKVSAHIQAMLDVRGTGGGIPTSKGDRIVFTWRVTGTAQIWRQDGPMKWPVQLTGGED